MISRERQSAALRMLNQALKDAVHHQMSQFYTELLGQPYFSCDAMHHRLHVLQQAGCYDRFALPANLRFEAVEPTHSFTGKEAAYLIFEDGSLYYSNNAEHEVWADAVDFAHQYFDDAGTDRGVALENLEPMDIQLLRHLADVTNGFAETADEAEKVLQ